MSSSKEFPISETPILDTLELLGSLETTFKGILTV